MVNKPILNISDVLSFSSSKGGGCIFCGSVEHLKRDCQRKVEKDLRAGIKVRTLNSGDLEDEPALESTGNKKKKGQNKVKPAAKVVAF
jgi:hypothetical protein